jgi:hypothetical protein
MQGSDIVLIVIAILFPPVSTVHPSPYFSPRRVLLKGCGGHDDWCMRLPLIDKAKLKCHE